MDGGGGPAAVVAGVCVMAFLLLAVDVDRPSVICGRVRLAFAADGAMEGRSDTLNCIPPVYISFHRIGVNTHIQYIHT